MSLSVGSHGRGLICFGFAPEVSFFEVAILLYLNAFRFADNKPRHCIRIIMMEKCKLKMRVEKCCSSLNVLVKYGFS